MTSYRISIAVALLLGTFALEAQTAPPAGNKALAFDVASIRQNLTPHPELSMGPTADGYRMAGTSLLVPLLSAYTPTTGQIAYTLEKIKGLPAWALQEHYDLDARIDPALETEWADPEKQRALLPILLANLLTERCKLAVHREHQTMSGYSLVIGKNGSKLTESKPGVEHPDARPLPWGGKIAFETRDKRFYLHFYDVSAGYLAIVFEQWVGATVTDKTGLKGRYDFEINADLGDQDELAAHAAQQAAQLGLKLTLEKNDVEILVIDHMERPSEN